MGYQVRNGIYCTMFSSMQSMHLIGTWTQTSSDTSPLQGPVSISKQWGHHHLHQTKNMHVNTMDSVLELMFTWEVISMRTLQCLLFKHTLTTTIMSSMIKSYFILHSQELGWLLHFGLVTFFCSIHMNHALFHLAAVEKMTYLSFPLTLKWQLLV